MEFERALRLLAYTNAAEVPVLASVHDQPGPRRFLLRKTFEEAKLTTMHLQSFPSTLPCPHSPHLTSLERHRFNNPATAPATTPVCDLYRTIRVMSGRSGRKYFCHETRLDSDVRYLLKNNRHPLKIILQAGVEVKKL